MSPFPFPKRDPKIPNPLITGKEDQCVAPYMTVIRNPQTRRFRIWYNVYKSKHKDGSARFAYLESEDGIHWIRPHRVLKDPGPINFGCAVIDEGPDYPDSSRRFKLGWWAKGGLNLAVSADGLHWTMLRPYPVLRHNHDINNIFWDPIRSRYMATVSAYVTGAKWSGLRRTTMHSASRNLLDWQKPWYVITADDSIDEGQTQFYAMQGYLARGNLLIGLVKILRDRYVARAAGPDGGILRTRPVILAGSKLTVNAAVTGDLRVRLLDPAGKPIPGFDADDCKPISGAAAAATCQEVAASQPHLGMQPRKRSRSATAISRRSCRRWQPKATLCRKTRRVSAGTHAKVAVFPRACKHAPYRSVFTVRFPTKPSAASIFSRANSRVWAWDETSDGLRVSCSLASCGHTTG